jgi:hypothetical protein
MPEPQDGRHHFHGRGRDGARRLTVFVITGRIKVPSYRDAAKKFEEGLAPILKRTPGFRGCYSIDAGDGVGVGIVAFETQEDAERSRDEVNDWIEKNIAPQYLAEPVTEAGELILTIMPDAPPSQPGAGAGSGAMLH